MEKSNVYLYVAELAVKSSFALSARYRHFFEGEKGKLLFEKLSEDEQRLILSDIQHYTVNSLCGIACTAKAAVKLVSLQLLQKGPNFLAVNFLPN